MAWLATGQIFDHCRQAGFGLQSATGSDQRPRGSRAGHGGRDAERLQAVKACSRVVPLELSTVAAALRSLPPRQREALMLRYYGDLSEAQIASVMGTRRGAVKNHTARAMSTLRLMLEAET